MVSARFRVVSQGDGWWDIEQLGAFGWKRVHTDMNPQASAFDLFDTLDKAKAFVSSQCDRPVDRQALRASRTPSGETGGEDA